jgi:hypothetical protein
MTTNDQLRIHDCAVAGPEVPALSEAASIKALIDDARALRLELVKLGSCEPLSEPAQKAVEGLSQTGIQLERIIEVVTSAQNRRRRRTITNKP